MQNRHGVDYLSTDTFFIPTPPDNIIVFVEPGDEKYFLGSVLEKEKGKDKEGTWKEDTYK